MSAVGSARKTLGAAGETVKRAFTNTSDYISKLTLREAVIWASIFVGILVLVSQLLIGFWQRYLPSALIGLVRFLVYIIIPIVFVFSTAFGMWLENKYARYEELSEWIQEKSSEANEFVFGKKHR